VSALVQHGVKPKQKRCSGGTFTICEHMNCHVQSFQSRYKSSP
jgi:hypothetical protein